MKHLYFPNKQIKIQTISVSLAKGKALVRGCSISGIPQRSEDNCEACFSKKEIVR